MAWGEGDVGVWDTRLVQTAVIGDEHADVPVVLPAEAIKLDVFRHRASTTVTKSAFADAPPAQLRIR